jgi:hypothetical protein
MLAKYRAHPPTSRTYYLVRVACDITTATAHAGSGSLALKAKRLLLGSVAGPCSLSPHPPRPHVTKTALMQGAKLLTAPTRWKTRHGICYRPKTLRTETQIRKPCRLLPKGSRCVFQVFNKSPCSGHHDQRSRRRRNVREGEMSVWTWSVRDGRLHAARRR